MTDYVKCISLHEPWAILCFLLQENGRAEKPFETRGFATKHRGLLLIHAAKKWDASLVKVCRSEPFASVLPKHGLTRGGMWMLPTGRILGAVIVEDCYRVHRDRDGDVGLYGTDDFLHMPTGNELAFGDFTVGRYAWKLANPIRFANPIPFRGAQGFFNVPREVVADQLGRAA